MVGCMGTGVCADGQKPHQAEATSQILFPGNVEQVGDSQTAVTEGLEEFLE